MTVHDLDENGAPSGDPRFALASGLVLSVFDTWHFLTAGHILEKLQHPSIRVSGAQLNDTFGPSPASTYPIPFDFASAPKYFVCDAEEGLDFGLVALHPHYQRLLEVNGIVPLSEVNWAHVEDHDFDRHFLLGFPRELISYEIATDGQSTWSEASIQCVLAPLRKLDSPPATAKKTKQPRFAGELLDGNQLESVEGMSGGPIFGFPKGISDRYWIVAVQSMWLPRSRVTLGLPVSVLVSLIERELAENQSTDSESSG